MECQTPKEENKLAIRFLAVGEQIYEGDEVTQETVDHLLQQIQTEQVVSGYLSLDEYGEDGDDFLTIDKKDGWAALAFNTWDEDGIAHLYQPVAQDDHTQEQAPVFIGGQTPVLKRNALCDVQTIVDCVLCFAKTGKPAPNLEWEEVEFC